MMTPWSVYLSGGNCIIPNIHERSIWLPIEVSEAEASGLIALGYCVTREDGGTIIELANAAPDTGMVEYMKSIEPA